MFNELPPAALFGTDRSWFSSRLASPQAPTTSASSAGVYSSVKPIRVITKVPGARGTKQDRFHKAKEAGFLPLCSLLAYGQGQHQLAPSVVADAGLRFTGTHWHEVAVTSTPRQVSHRTHLGTRVAHNHLGFEGRHHRPLFCGGCRSERGGVSTLDEAQLTRRSAGAPPTPPDERRRRSADRAWLGCRSR